MNNTELQIIKQNIQSQLTNKQVAPLIIAGSPGSAKSTSVRLLAQELDINIVEYSLPTISVERMSGLPQEVATPKYNKAAVLDYGNVISTIWTIPEMIADVWNAAESKPTVLLLDDFHGMAPHMQTYFYSLLLDRRLGNYKLPENCAIIGTMNNSDSAGFHGIGSAIRNRLSILEVQFDFEHWFKSYGNRLHYLVASFLKAKPHYCTEDETTTIQGYATARAWTAIAAELAPHTPEFVQSHAGRIAGMQVSPEAAKAFQTHVMYVASIDFTNLVKSKTIVDLSTKDPLDTIIYSYVTNFIQTPEDGLYLFELMSANKSEATSGFIGFVMGELYIKYQHQTVDRPISDGIRFIINKIMSKPINSDEYDNPKALSKVVDKPIKDIQLFLKYAHEFLM